MATKNYEIRRSSKGFEIVGPPKGSSIKEYDTILSQQMRKIRLGISQLQTARDILDEGNRVFSSDNILMREAIAVAASTYYFSVFQGGELGRKLSPTKVYKGKPEALERHNDWRQFRDNRFNHVGNVRRAIRSGVITEPTGDFYDIITFGVDIPIGQQREWLQILYQLISHTLDFLDAEAESTFRKLQEEVEGMFKEDFDALPEFRIEIPNE